MKVLILALAVGMLTVPAHAGLFSSQDDAYCRSLGAVPGTDIYVQCRIYRDQARRQALNRFNRFLLQQSAPPPHQQTCTTRWNGSAWVTTCF